MSKGSAPPLTYSLTLKPSVISTVGSVAPEDITDLARDWTHTTRLQGGFWTGSFTVRGKRMFGAFDTWLGCHIEERSGGPITWEGLVYEMELSTGGFVYRASLDEMWNTTRSYYYDPNWNGLNESPFITNTASIARFGRKEQVIYVNTIVNELADAVSARYLAEYGWPWARVVGVCPMDKDELHVTVNGYAFIMSWRFLTGGACWMPNWEDCNDPDDPWYPCDSDTPATDVRSIHGTTAWDDVPAPDEYWLQSTDPVATIDFSLYETNPALVTTDIRTWAKAMVTLQALGHEGTGWAYLGLAFDIDGTHDGVYLYTTPELTTMGINPATFDFGLVDYFFIHQGTDVWMQKLLNADYGVFFTQNIQTNHMIVARHNENRADISSERGWDAVMRAVSLSDYDYNPWRAWIGPDRQFNFQPISTDPVVYVLDGQWRSSPEASGLNPWQLRPGVGKILNFRYAPPRTGYWLQDPATFLIEEITVDSMGNIQPAMAEISQTENLMTYLATLPRISAQPTGGGGAGGPANPPNWNVEAGRPNELGPGGDTHGYWTVQDGAYVWVHDESINLSSWWDPIANKVEYVHGHR